MTKEMNTRMEAMKTRKVIAADKANREFIGFRLLKYKKVFK